MVQLTKQEKKLLEGKFKKAFKGLVRDGYDKKELKKFDFETLDIDEEKKNSFINADDAQFLELLKEELKAKEEPVAEETPVEEAPAEEKTSDEVSEEEAPVEEQPAEEKTSDEVSEEEAPAEEKTSDEVSEEEVPEENKKSAQEEFLEKAKAIMGEEEVKSNPEPAVDPDEEKQDEELTPEQSEALEKKELEKAKKDTKKKPEKKPAKKEDDSEDDEEDDNEEDKEEDEALQGYNKKVLLKLKIASDRTQKYYSDLRNELRCYKALKFKSNNTGDTYAYKGKVVFKVTIFPKALKVYYALDPKKFDVKKYHHKDAKDIKKYETIPLLFRIGSDRSYKYALEILKELAKKLKIARTNAKPFDYMADFNTTSKALLIENGGEELLRASCTKDHSDVISDSLAKKCMMLRVRKPIEGEKVIAEISIGELSAAFKTSYKIDIELLKKVGLVNKDANYLKVTAMNNCYKAISISADEYEPEVIRMVVVTGGNIIKLVK